MVARRSAFEAVGGFDEDFFLYFEEIDLCRRLGEGGWRIVWRGDAEVVHEQGASIPSEWTTSAMASARRLFFKKRVGLRRWALIEFRLVVFFAASVLHASLASMIKPRTAGLRIWRLSYAWDNRVFLRSTRPKLQGTTR
jgi:N-acetylglucosaminyl-diphospho-decaprenol L-rhamnosyltransferase